MMNNLMITTIDFEYEDGKEEPFTGVTIDFRSINTTFDLSGTVFLYSSEYNNTESIDDLRTAVMDKVVSEFGLKIDKED